MSKRKPFKLYDDEIQALRDIVSINDDQPPADDRNGDDDERR